MRTIFPKTLELLQDNSFVHIPEQFGRTVREELALPPAEDSSRWFPVFLKVRLVPQKILEVAEFEYLRHLVLSESFIEPKPMAGNAAPAPEVSLDLTVSLNASLQFVELHHSQRKLSRDSGLYCFFKCQGRFMEYQLGLAQALLVDLLHEERSYTARQLAESANQHPLGVAIPGAEWQEKISELIRLGILVLRTS